MIKIERIEAPSQLTPEVVADKTRQYKENHNKAVWREPYIESTLMKMSNEKCSYCECKLGIESNFMEVEHFHDKSSNPDEVVVWENLLPSCKNCNGNKGDHDTVMYPIVNPTIDDPRNHLGFKDFRYKGKTDIGKETVLCLDLNDTEKQCMARFKICTELNKKIEELLDSLDDLEGFTARKREIRKTKIKNSVIDLLENCQCDRAYTAIKATTLANNNDYSRLVDNMKRLCLWTSQHEILECKMKKYVMDII